MRKGRNNKMILTFQTLDLLVPRQAGRLLQTVLSWLGNSIWNSLRWIKSSLRLKIAPLVRIIDSLIGVITPLIWVTKTPLTRVIPSLRIVVMTVPIRFSARRFWLLRRCRIVIACRLGIFNRVSSIGSFLISRLRWSRKNG